MTASQLAAPRTTSAHAGRDNATATPTIAFLGTGRMGGPMAANLARAGFDVRAWDRTTSRGNDRRIPYLRPPARPRSSLDRRPGRPAAPRWRSPMRFYRAGGVPPSGTPTMTWPPSTPRRNFTRDAQMHDTGFPRADAENDFARARRHRVLAAAAHPLRGRGGGDRLLTLDEVAGPCGWRVQRQLGLQTIPVKTIVGTAGQRHDFDHRFRPTTNRVRARWEGLALAQRLGEPIPPIEVYRVRGRHFVSDGHHRVSIAAATGQPAIDAYVTEILTTAQSRGPAPAAGLNSGSG